MNKNKNGNKKHDLRDEAPARTSITNTQSRMAGGADNPVMSTVDDTPLKHPGTEGHDGPIEGVKDS